MGDINHGACVRGFVISQAPLGRTVIVHYWQLGAIGVTLRTGPHGQATDSDRLVVADSCDQSLVDKLLAGMV